MANANRLYSNIMSGIISTSLNASATSVTSAAFSLLPIIDSTNHMLITIDNEIFRIIGHTSASTTCTFDTRGLPTTPDASTAATHNNGAIWIHSLVASDLAPLTVTLSSSTTVTNQFGNYLINAASGALNITLTSPINTMNLNIKKTDSSANTVTIHPQGAQTIDGASTLVISTQYVSKNITSDGSNYFVV